MVLPYPIHYTHMAHPKDAFYFPKRNPFNIQLQRFYHVIRINTFSLFHHRKKVAALLAPVTLPLFYNATFHVIFRLAFWTMNGFHKAINLDKYTNLA
jgi:hypothetical protein